MHYITTAYETLVTLMPGNVTKPGDAPEAKKEIPTPIKDKLDPITILVTCALMKYKEPESRLTYSNDLRVYIQQPKDYNILGINILPRVRELKGQSHDDVGVVSLALEKVAKWHQPHIAEKSAYKTLLEWARTGLDELKETYKKNDTDLAVSAINNLTTSIQTYSTQGIASAGPLEGQVKKVCDLWELKDIERVTGLFQQMSEKQGKTPISEKVLCGDEIGQVEYLLTQKHAKLYQIWFK